METGLTVRIDPHVHSEGSYDGTEPVDRILSHARDIGLDGVVITDHDVIDESLRAVELAPEYGLIGIPGVEVSTAHGHLLAIGVEDLPESGQSFERTVDEVRTLGGVAIVPHPFQRSRHGVSKRHIRHCDAVEVYNSMVFTGYRNRRAHAFARRRQFPVVGASDAHSLPWVGRAYTEIDVPVAESVDSVDAEQITTAIRNGTTNIEGSRTPILRSASQYTKGAIRKTGCTVSARFPILGSPTQYVRERGLTHRLVRGTGDER